MLLLKVTFERFSFIYCGNGALSFYTTLKRQKLVGSFRTRSKSWRYVILSARLGV